MLPVLILPNLLGMDGVWLSITTGEILSMIMSIYYFMKYRKSGVRSKKDFIDESNQEKVFSCAK